MDYVVGYYTYMKSYIVAIMAREQNNKMTSKCFGCITCTKPDEISYTYGCNKDGIIHNISLRSHTSKFLNYDIFLYQKIVMTTTNSADYYAAFHLGLHCLPKYLC